MVEGFFLFPSLIRPVLLFAVGLMVEVAAVERIPDGLVRSDLPFLFAIVRHHSRLCDGDTVFPLAIKAAIPHVGFEEIRFSPAVRSIFNGRPQDALLIGQSVRCNCRGHLNYREERNRGPSICNLSSI